VSAVTTYQKRLAGIRASTANAVMAQWDQLPNYEKPVTESFARRVTPIVASGQLLAARTTAAYIGRRTGLRMPAMTAAAVTGQAARNVDPLEEYQRPFGHMWSALGDGTAYPDAVKMGRARLGIYVVTDVWLAMRAATEVIDKATPKITSWVRVADGGACPDCSAADGMETSAAGDLAGHPNCFPGDTVVSASAKVAFRRWYAGKVVTITTASGQELTATGNHPILTDTGWVPAHLLSEGDNVVRGTVQHRRPYEQHRPARIEDVWSAGAVSGLRRMPIAPEDFHGDGTHGEVDVVDALGLLPSESNASRGQQFGQHGLMWGRGSGRHFLRRCPLHSLVDGGLPAPSGAVGSGDLSSSLVLAQSGHLHGRDLGQRASGYAGLLQPPSDQGPRDPEPLGYGPFSLASEIGLRNLGRFDRKPAGPRFDAPSVEFANDHRGAHASRGLDLLRRLAGQVQLDRIVSLSVRDFSGHVFNLSTVEGWYCANSLVVSNCGCTSEPRTSGDPSSEAADPSVIDVQHHDELGAVLVAA
jgi:hypothetical protein